MQKTHRGFTTQRTRLPWESVRWRVHVPKGGPPRSKTLVASKVTTIRPALSCTSTLITLSVASMVTLPLDGLGQTHSSAFTNLGEPYHILHPLSRCCRFRRSEQTSQQSAKFISYRFTSVELQGKRIMFTALLASYQPRVRKYHFCLSDFFGKRIIKYNIFRLIPFLDLIF